MSNPTPFVRWATLLNYPVLGKLWDSTPTKVAPAYINTGFTPGVPPAAYELNSLFSGCAVTGQYAVVAAAQNFQVQVTFPSGSVGGSTTNGGPYMMAWNDVTGQWVASAALVGTKGGVMSNGGHDNTWATGFTTSGVSPMTSAPRVLGVDSAGAVYIDSVSGTNVDIWKCPVGGSFASINTTPPTITGLAGLQLVVLGTTLIAAAPGTGGAGKLGVLTANTFTAGITGITASYILKQNGTTVLAVSKQANSTASISTNGTAWTSQNLSSVIGATSVPLDAAWDPVQQLWLMAVADTGSSSRTAFYTSADGQTWSYTGTTLTATAQVTSVAAFQGLWLAASYTTGTFTSQLIYSWDGVIWRGSGVVLTSTSAAAPTVTTSPNQIMLANNIPLTASSFTTTRSSLFAGAPDVALA